MGSENKEKWLLRLKDSVENHSEPLPDSFWEDMSKEIPAPAPVKRGRRRFVWAACAAAVAVLAFMLLAPEVETPSTGDYVAQENLQNLDMLDKHFQQEDIERTDVKPGDIGHMAQSHKVSEGEVVIADENMQVDKRADSEYAGEEEGVVEDRKNPEGESVKAEKSRKPAEEKSKEKEQRMKEREEYLKELEYLQNDGKKEFRREKRRTYLALAAGNSGISFGSSMEQAPTAGPNQGGTADGAGIIEESNNMTFLNGYVNMDYKPEGDIEWLGSKSPNIFNTAKEYKNYGYDHGTPVRLGLSVAKEIREGLYVESGISYQYMKSRMLRSGRGTVQKLHYLGIPLKLQARLVQGGSFSLYLSGGYLLEKCIYGVLEHDDGSDEKLSVSKLQNSLNASIGMQLGLGGGASLYIEPGVYYYLGMQDGWIAKDKGYVIKNRYSDDPKGFSFQGGLRFAF